MTFREYRDTGSTGTPPMFRLVFKGETVATGNPGPENTPKTRHLNSSDERSYDALIADGTVADGVFVRDWEASSPSRACSVVLGSRYGGLDKWRTEDGTTLREHLGSK